MCRKWSFLSALLIYNGMLFGPSSASIRNKSCRPMRYHGKFQCVVSLKFCRSFVLVLKIRNSNSEFFESFILINSIDIMKGVKILINFDTTTNVRENFEKYLLNKFWVIYWEKFQEFFRKTTEKFRKTLQIFRKVSRNIAEILEKYFKISRIIILYH